MQCADMVFINSYHVAIDANRYIILLLPYIILLLPSRISSFHSFKQCSLLSIHQLNSSLQYAYFTVLFPVRLRLFLRHEAYLFPYD